MKKKCFILIIIIFSIAFIIVRSELAIKSITNRSVENQIRNKILGTTDFNHNNDIYKLELIMYDGEYSYVEDIGPFYGDNWTGKCKLVLTKNGTVISKLLLANWEEDMLFNKVFDIKLYICAEHDSYIFSIGQYLSSNINEYRLYEISKCLELKALGSRIINISGEDRYSCELNIDNLGNLSYQYYDNSTGDYIEKSINVYTQH